LINFLTLIAYYIYCRPGLKGLYVSMSCDDIMLFERALCMYICTKKLNCSSR